MSFDKTSEWYIFFRTADVVSVHYFKNNLFTAYNSEFKSLDLHLSLIKNVYIPTDSIVCVININLEVVLGYKSDVIYIPSVHIM